MRIARYLMLAALVAASAAITGCGALKLKDYDRAANRDISTIALLDVDEPWQFQLISQTGVQVMWPMVSSGIRIDQRSLTASRAYQELALGQRLTTALATALTEAGYQIVRVAATRRRAGEFGDDYAGIRSDADAILDVVIADGGYSQAGVDGIFAAYVYTKARLVKLPRHDVVYSDNAVIYQATGHEATISRDAQGFGQAGVVTKIEQADLGVFRGRAEIIDDPVRAIRGFDNSAAVLAAYYRKALAR